MGFRTLEIGQASEIHIKESQLEVLSKDGLARIPVEDLNHIIVHGANIRLSTMDLSILSRNKVTITTLDEKYMPTAIVLPFEGHSRQSKLMHAQVNANNSLKNTLWQQIIRQKICNQARALSIIGVDGVETIIKYADALTFEKADYYEVLAAKEYFGFYHKGLNRRSEDPINSRLNYGYAVVRSAIARSLVATGFHPTFGLHHDNQLNAFNLADDLIEPYRAIVDLSAHEIISSNIRLSKSERFKLASVLHCACVVEGTKVNVMSSIDIMVESLKRIILEHSSEELKLPVVIPIEPMEGVTE